MIEGTSQKGTMAQKLGILGPMFNMLGGVSGLIALGGLLVWGGSIDRQVRVDSDRLTTLETKGSVSLQKHESADSSSKAEIERRLTLLEAAIVKLNDISSDLKLINLKLELQGKSMTEINDQLKEHMKKAP